MAIPYYHVDSFAAEIFAGNPAGVCILPAFPTDALMRGMAAENRHSETAFLVPRPDGEFDLRWFTPEVEDDLCGHATLACAFVLALRGQPVWPVRFHTCSGLLTVARRGDGFEMDFPARPPQPCQTPTALFPALGLQSALVMKSRDYLVVVDRAEQVRALAPNFAALAKLDTQSSAPATGIGGTIVTAPGDGDVDYVCRLFAPAAGIDEDPATGSIHIPGALLGGAAGQRYVPCAAAQRARRIHGVPHRRRSSEDCGHGTPVPARHDRNLTREEAGLRGPRRLRACPTTGAYWTVCVSVPVLPAKSTLPL